MKRYIFSAIILFLGLTSFGQSGAGYCLEFSGGPNYVEVPYSSSLNPTAAMSVEAWIYPTAFGLNPWTNTIVSTDAWAGPNGEEGYVLRCGGTGILSFNFATASSWKEVVSTTNMSLNTWYHVAGTFDGTTLKVYINGENVGTTSYSGPIKASTRKLQIGRLVEPSQTREFAGEIDEVRIWNKALTESEIRENMCRKLSGSENGLLAYYRFDEGSGNTVNDLSGNNHAGTLNAANTPTWSNSSAHIGDTSIYIYPTSWNNISLSLSHPDLDSMTIDNVNGSPAGIQLYRVDQTPLDSVAPASLFTLLNNRYWGAVPCGGTSPSYRLRYNFAGYPGIINHSLLDLAGRTGGPAWSALNTSLSGQFLTKTLNSSSQFILASTGPQVNFHLLTPTDSASLMIQGANSQNIHFNWEKLDVSGPITYTWIFDSPTGNFTQPYATLPSDNNGADTILTMDYGTLDSLLDFSGLNVGNSKLFKWKVEASNGISASKHFYVIFDRGVVSLEEWEMITDLQVYPTVVKDGSLKFFNAGATPINGQLEIMDFSCKIIVSQHINWDPHQAGKIHLGNVSAGTYILKIQDDKRLYIQKLEVL